MFELDQDNNITLVNKFSGYDGGGGNIQVPLGSSDYFGYSSSVYIDEKAFTTHPELSLITPISATGRIINDTTPDLTIQSTEDGILSTEGQCEIITTDKSVTPVTDKTITISNIDGNAFSQGIYSNCTIVVTTTNKQEARLLLDTFSVGKPIIAVGAYADDDGGSNSGAVYVYEHNNSGEWEQTLKISNNESATGELDVDSLHQYAHFGSAVSAGTDTIAVGARGLDDGSSYAGGVYIFDRKNSIWSESLLISDNGGGAGKLDIQLNQYDYFGSSVSLNEDLLAVGAPYDDDGGNQNGAVYLFERSGDIWSAKTKISENDGIKDKVSIELDSSDYFGSSVSLYDSTLAVGAPYDDDGGSDNGAVYIFERDSNDEWVKQFKISENDGDEVGEINIDLDSSDNFGSSVALYDDVLVIGALYDDDGYSNSGAVYIFKKENNTWVNKLKLSAANSISIIIFCK